MDNQNAVSLKFTNQVTGQNKITKYAEQLKTVYTYLQAIDGNKIANLDKSAVSIGNVEKETKKVSEATSIAFSTAKIYAFARGIETLTKKISSYTKKSADYLENWNLLDVAFQNNTVGAEKFVNTLSEMYGLDESWGYRTVGIFKQLSNAMGLSAETGEKLSKTLTQLAIDTSSLYNIDVADTASILQSGLAGQTKPVRRLGGDITQTTLQLTLDQYGINRAITDLSYVEKRLVIVTALLDQTSEASGDWGRTIESIANQMRIFQQQTERLTRALGNVFLPILQKILPFLNGFLMVLVEIVKWIGFLVGYNKNDFDYFSGADEDLVDLNYGVSDLGDGLEKASNSAKKLKNGLRSFDKLNNLTTPTSGGAGGSAGGGGIGGTGVSGDILDMFNKASDSYLNNLDKVKMKATEIRDQIMEWLGFTKHVNALTGEVSFTYGGIKKTLTNMAQGFSQLSTAGKAFAILGLGAVFLNIYNVGKKLVKLLGMTGLGKTIKALITPTKNLFDFMLAGIKGSHTSLQSSIKDWRIQQGIIDETGKRVKGFQGVVNTTKTALGGLAISIAGFGILDESMKSINKEGANVVNILGAIGGSLGTIVGAITVGASFGGIWGAIIGGTVGALATALEIFSNYPTEFSKTMDSIRAVGEETHKYNESLKQQYQAIEDNMQENLALQSAYENLANELFNIVDANGKIKEGYEDRATFIVTTLNKAYGLEMEIIDGKISKYGEEKKALQSIILEKRKQIILEAGEEAYNVALKEKVNTYNNLVKQEENYRKAQEERAELQEKIEKLQKNVYFQGDAGRTLIDGLKISLKNLQKEEDKQKKLLDEATDAYNSNTTAISNYTNLLSADVQQNQEKVEYYMNEIENTVYNGKEVIKLTHEQVLDDSLRFFTSFLKIAKENNQKITDDTIKNAQQRLNAEKTSLNEMTKNAKGEMSETLIEAWRTLGETSTSQFMKEFSKLPKDVQQNVVDKMQEKGKAISKELENGMKATNPELKIKVKADTSSFNLDSLVSKAKNAVDDIFSGFSNIFSNQRANGGVFDGKKWSPIPTYGSGGMPNVGQLFVANERGAELVGHIGGQTFVANQNQVLGMVDRKIQNASRGTEVFNIYLDKDHKLGTYTLDQLQSLSRANGKSITIG